MSQPPLFQSEEQSKVREMAAAMLSRRALSEAALYGKLLDKGVEEREAAQCVAWLVEIGALNDAQYAASVVRSYTAKGCGLYKVRAELHRRGIDEDTAAQALEQLPEPDEMLDEMIRKRMAGIRPDQKKMKKISDALYRKGFRWEDISAAFRRCLATEDLDQWE